MNVSRRGRLPMGMAQTLLVAAAAGLWAASRLTWVVLRSFDGLGPPKTTTLSGAMWSSALLPLALLLLATVVAAVAVRGWLLRTLALLVAVASLAAGYLAISLWVIPDVAMRAADLAHVSALSSAGSERHSLGPSITLVASVCTLASAVLLMRAAPSARSGTAKYLTPAARRSLAQSSGGVTSERMLWDALDDGWDPTQDRPDQPAESAMLPADDPPPEADTEGR